jgi:hypothetical protein
VEPLISALILRAPQRNHFGGRHYAALSQSRVATARESAGHSAALRQLGGSEMGYRIMGRIHAACSRAVAREAGQGTVEYVALVLLIAGVLAAVVAAGHRMNGAGIADTIVNKLKSAIDSVGG